MKKWLAGIAAVAMVGVFASTAGAHQQVGNLHFDCDQEEMYFKSFVPADHPIVLHIKVGTGAWQTLVTVDPGGSYGIAVAHVTDLLAEYSGPVQGQATWATGSGPVESAEVYCKSEPPTTAPTVPTTTKPPTLAPPLAPPVPVVVPPAFTG